MQELAWAAQELNAQRVHRQRTAQSNVTQKMKQEKRQAGRAASKASLEQMLPRAADGL